MELVIQTAPASEPWTLAEVKAHLRLDSSSYSGSQASYQSIVPGSHDVAASYSLKGSGVSVLDLPALVRLNAGACGSSGTVDAKIQEADTNTDASYTDWTGGGFTQVTESNDNAVQEIEYTGTKAYIRVVATVATAACSFAATVEVRAATHPEDTLLTSLIQAVREQVEDFTGRALISQTWNGYLDAFPSESFIELPKPNLISISSVKYRDKDWADSDDWTTWAATNYIAQTQSFLGRLVLGYGISWPSFTAYPSLPVWIQYVCGYGAARTSIPEIIRRAGLVRLATLYEYREEYITGTIISSLPGNTTFERALWPYRVRL